jgi:hypothetical protein
MHYNTLFVRIGILFFSMFVLSVPASAFAEETDLTSVAPEQWSFEHTGVSKAQMLTRGSRDVVVAIIDNGFDTFHPELRNNAWQNVNEIPDNDTDDDMNGYVDDVWGWDFVQHGDDDIGDNDPRPDATLNLEDVIDTIHHATLVAGIVGGNGAAFTGIAPQVRLMNLRIVDEGGIGTFSNLPRAIRYAVDNGADIINMSIIGSEGTGIRDAVDYAYDKGVAIVAAAGNDAYNLNVYPFFPVCADADELTPRIIGVSAIDESHYLSFFSNVGSSCIDITAPGSDITSTARFSPTNNLPDHILGGWNGTSFAAPFVTGALALIKSLQPAWTVAELYTAVLSTVHHTPSEDEDAYADLFGKGLIQIDKAVQYAYDRVVSRRIASVLTFVDARTGMAVDMSDGTMTPVRMRDPLKGIVDSTSFFDEGMRRYVTSRAISAHEQSITVYSDTWTELSSFRVTSSVGFSVAVGDVFGKGEQQIVLAPMGKSSELFRVYSVSGELLHTYDQTTSHTGVSLALSQAGEIAVYSEQGQSLGIDIFYHDMTAPVTHVEVAMLHKRGSISFGDIDGDRQDDIIVGGAKGEAPFVSLFGIDGEPKRTFSVYGGYQGGFTLESFDYDRDGKDDILTVPLLASEAVRVWTGRAKKIEDVHVFGSQELSQVFPLVALQYYE